MHFLSETVQQAESHADFIMGFICRNKLSDNPNLVHMTPGMNTRPPLYGRKCYI